MTRVVSCCFPRPGDGPPLAGRLILFRSKTCSAGVTRHAARTDTFFIGYKNCDCASATTVAGPGSKEFKPTACTFMVYC